MAGLIPAAAQSHILVAPSQKVPYTDKDTGHLHSVGYQQAKQMQEFLTGTSRRIPCSCTNSGNVYTLTPTPGGPLVVGYFDYEAFPFVASASSTGPVTATVVPNGPAANPTLATLNVYKNNGGTQATNGDIVVSRQYEFTFVDSLNSGAGGLVLR